ncbi:MAG TPA: serine protease [Thermoanaerobaculia bacterium]|nr:serine protease [Thermoanaerobaculia bacterium]
MATKSTVLCVLVLLLSAIAGNGQSVGPLLHQPGAKQEPNVVRPLLLLANELAKAPLHSLPAARIAALDSLSAMRAWNAARRRPTQNGFARPLALPVEVVLSAGHATAVAESGGIGVDGGQGAIAWATRIHVDEAYRLRLHLVDVQLPPGARIWVWGSGEEAREFGLELKAPAGDLWTPSVEGPDLMLEVHAPVSAVAARFTLREVLELFRLDTAQPLSSATNHGPSVLAFPSGSTGWSAGEERVVPSQDSTACLVDAACVQSSGLLTVLQHAVAQLQFVEGKNGFLCTGGLLNNTRADGTPYLLTAHHCLSDQVVASTLEAFFQYEDPSCGIAAPQESTFPHTNGATFLATGVTGSQSDFTLVRLAGSIPGNSDFLGWNADAGVLTNGALLFRISYPLGRPQALSETQFLASGTECAGTLRPNYIYSAKVPNGGDTAGGSSGAPVVMENGQVVGQLLGECGDPFNNCNQINTDVDGAFSQTFPAIAQWLSPSTGGGPCAPSSNTLCLDDHPGDQRFQVQVTVNTAEGGGLHGPGTDISLASLGISQGGIFWFFGATNPEMLIKVVNACPIGSQIWIFYAALTNVGFSVTVTDTQTGHSRTYTNPDLTTAAPVQDTSALPCS